MVLKQVWRLIHDELFHIASTDLLFNQYTDFDPRVDLPNAVEIRRQNLFAYLESFRKAPHVLAVGEAAGPWGCRFSGVAFTGERQLADDELPFRGLRSSKEKPSLARRRKRAPFISHSASIFWRVMQKHHPSFLVWDCVPLHPHKPDDILSVRTPKVKEIRVFSKLLGRLLDTLHPGAIVAIGRKAEKALERVDVKATYVRHPANGGARRFEEEIERFLEDNP